MAGSFAKVYNKIWADPDFRSLSRDLQWLFFMLISQPDLNFAGVTTCSPKRLVGCADDFTLDQLNEGLRALQARRYVVFDEEHDEILVRSFIRHDGAWKTPNVLLSIVRDVDTVRSVRIRAVLVQEFERLDVGALAGKKADEMRAQLATVTATLRTGLPEPIPEPFPQGMAEGFRDGLAKPLPEPMAQPMAEPTVVVAVVGEGVKDRTSVSLHQDQPTPAEPAASGDGVLIHLPVPEPGKDPKPPEPGSDQDLLFVAFWDAYPRKVGKPSARAAWKKAVTKSRADPDLVIAAAKRFQDDPIRRASAENYTPHPATWLNDERYNDQPAQDRPPQWDDVVEHAPREFNRR